VLKGGRVTLVVSGVCLLLACAGEPVASALAWDRSAILQGQAWRLWTGHLVHFSGSHAGADVLALFATGLLAEPLLGARRFALTLLGGAALVSLGLLAFAPALAEDRGASGLATLTAVLAGALAWRRHPVARPVLGCAMVVLALKTLWEAGSQTAALADLPMGVAVSWQAHLLGALLGAFTASMSKVVSAGHA
jgi:rhomboid family GlyGly-CTERM serine protease